MADTDAKALAEEAGAIPEIKYECKFAIFRLVSAAAANFTC